MTRAQELEEQEIDALHRASLAAMLNQWDAHAYWHTVAQEALDARIAVAKEQMQ